MTFSNAFPSNKYFIFWVKFQLVPIATTAALVQVMAWSHTGNKPSPKGNNTPQFHSGIWSTKSKWVKFVEFWAPPWSIIKDQWVKHNPSIECLLLHDATPRINELKIFPLIEFLLLHDASLRTNGLKHNPFIEYFAPLLWIYASVETERLSIIWFRVPWVH